MARAARLLAGIYTLVATNVPYLLAGKQNEVLRHFCEEHHPKTSGDLATSFVDRCRTFTTPLGTYAVVTPQNWLFQRSYKSMRIHLLSEQALDHISSLGARAFETITGEIVKVALIIITNKPPANEQLTTGIDVSDYKSANEKNRQGKGAD